MEVAGLVVQSMKHPKDQPAIAPAIPENPERERGIKALQDRPHEFDFFQAVRWWDAGVDGGQFPPTGYSESRAGDSVHFGQRPFLVFAPRTLDQFSHQPVAVESARFRKPVMLVFFLGLLGPSGPLPLHLTEYALGRQGNGDFAFTNFLNIFSHRLISLYYRAWSAPRLEIALDRQDMRRPIRFVGCLTGCFAQARSSATSAQMPSAGSAGAEDVSISAQAGALDDWSKLYYSGHLASRTRHPEGLASILTSYFGMKASVIPFVGRWLQVPREDLTRLGSTSTAGLGVSTLLGARVWDCQSSVRIRFGPLSFAEFQRLLPGTPGSKRLKSWISTYLGPELDWDLQLVLARDQVPETRLDGSGRLGLTTFLKSRPMKEDAESVVFDLQVAA